MLEIDYDGDRLIWDSSRGPMYGVTLNTGELQFCSCEDAQIIDNVTTDTKTDKGFNPLWIIIPVLVVMGGIATVFIIRRKKA